MRGTCARLLAGGWDAIQVISRGHFACWWHQVSVLGACLGEPAQACLIMELVEGGSLAQRIHDRKKRRLTYVQILQASAFGVQVARALSHNCTARQCVCCCA